MVELCLIGAGNDANRFDSHMNKSLLMSCCALCAVVTTTGDAPLDTGVDTITHDRGRVVGENDSPYAAALEFSYHWK